MKQLTTEQSIKIDLEADSVDGHLLLELSFLPVMLKAFSRIDISNMIKDDISVLTFTLHQLWSEAELDPIQWSNKEWCTKPNEILNQEYELWNTGYALDENLNIVLWDDYYKKDLVC